MKKKALTALLTLSMLGTLTAPAFAADPTLLIKPPVISQKEDSAAHQYPIEIDGQTLDASACVVVPLRPVATALGFTVTWSKDGILVDNGTVHTTVTLGVDRYLTSTSVEGLVGTSAPFSLGTPPYAVNGVSYVPLGLFHVLLGNRDDAVALENSKVVIHSGKPQLPNPFVTCKTMAEAEKIAGFSLTPPATLPNWMQETVIRVSESKMIEMIFTGDANQLTLRKAAGKDDISGDYNRYQTVEAVNVDGVQVTMKGSDGKVHVAIWTKDGYSYAINAAPGMNQDHVSAMVRTMQ